MTLQISPQPQTPPPAADWLQPVRLPLSEWSDFSLRIQASLEELEHRHRSKPLSRYGGLGRVESAKAEDPQRG